MFWLLHKPVYIVYVAPDVTVTMWYNLYRDIVESTRKFVVIFSRSQNWNIWLCRPLAGFIASLSWCYFWNSVLFHRKLLPMRNTCKSFHCVNIFPNIVSVQSENSGFGIQTMFMWLEKYTAKVPSDTSNPFLLDLDPIASHKERGKYIVVYVTWMYILPVNICSII